MDDEPAHEDAVMPQEPSSSGSQEDLEAKISKLQRDFQSRLIAANLRTEAVRAGMVDLDGLRMIDTSEVQLGPDDRIVGSRQLMDELRRQKPWLFVSASSSSGATAPASQPVRQKSALEMSPEEYAAARATLIKRRF